MDIKFKFHATTSSASISSVTDQTVAYEKIKEFVDTYNGITSTLESLTSRGVNGEDKVVLARDLTVNSTKEIYAQLLLPNYRVMVLKEDTYRNLA